MLIRDSNSNTNAGSLLGMAFICQPDGQILDVIRDDFGLAPESLEPDLQQLVDAGSLPKLENFLDELRQQGSAFGWELNLFYQDHLTPVHFAGGASQGKMLILAAQDRLEIFHLYQELFQTQNDYIDSLHDIILGKTVESQIKTERDNVLLDDLTALNNQLANLQRELAKKNTQLEHLNQEKNRFLGMAAHDLRNPLQSILNHSSFLLEEDPAALGKDFHTFMEAIYSSSEFMAHLVDDLLDVAKIESGKLDLDYSAVDMNTLVSRNVTLNRMFAAKKQIKIEIIAELLPKVLLDSAKIEQVLNNLLGNAIKFSPMGSRIEVRIYREADGFRLSIKDEGPGISAEESSKLFKPFQRGKAKGSAGEKSTGLGLMIVKRIVEGHGGKIWLESQVGAGTTFFVSLPLMPPDESARFA
jgi:two-component system, OmpR family, sensor kinase